MAWTSAQRLSSPLPIEYDQAIIVAILGLTVNVACAVILGYQGGAHANHSHDAEETHPDHAHARHISGHRHHDQADLNLKSAYLHVVADATTSVLAIAALLGVRYFGLMWLDPLMGIVGAALILRWSYSLLKDTSGVLLELAHRADASLVGHIKGHLESDGDTRVSDLHLWKVAQDRYACVVSLVTGAARTTEEYKARLRQHGELAHVTVEVYQCRDAA